MYFKYKILIATPQSTCNRADFLSLSFQKLKMPKLKKVKEDLKFVPYASGFKPPNKHRQLKAVGFFSNRYKIYFTIGVFLTNTVTFRYEVLFYTLSFSC
jgi:hypothetical protein